MFKFVILSALVIAASARPEELARVQRSLGSYYDDSGERGFSGSYAQAHSVSGGGYHGGRPWGYGHYPGGYEHYPGGYERYPGGYGHYPGGYGGVPSFGGGYSGASAQAGSFGFGFGKRK